MKRQGQLPIGSPPRLQVGSRWVLRASGASERHEIYKVNTVDFPRFCPIPQQASSTVSNVWLDEVEAVDEMLGITTMHLKWLGVLGSIPPPKYQMRGAKISAPIDSNPNFPLFVIAAGGKGVGMAMFDDNGKFLGFGKDSTDQALVGLSTFDDTAVIYTVDMVSGSRRTDLLSKLQTICTPLGNPPTQFSNQKQNWKMSDINEVTIGPSAFYEYQIVYELSSIGGWYPGLYSTNARKGTYGTPSAP